MYEHFDIIQSYMFIAKVFERALCDHLYNFFYLYTASRKIE